MAWPHFRADFGQFIARLGVKRRENDADPRLFERFEKTLLDGVRFDAPARLRMPSRFTDEVLLRQWDQADYQSVDHRLLVWASLFQNQLRKLGIPVFVHNAFRTKEQQLAAKLAGHSKTTWPNGPHCIGEAVDIVHSRFAWEMTVGEWSFLHKVGRDVLQRLNSISPASSRLFLVWGGDWDGDGDLYDSSLFDPAHWQIADYRSRIRKIEPGPRLRYTPRGFLAKYGAVF